MRKYLLLVFAVCALISSGCKKEIPAFHVTSIGGDVHKANKFMNIEWAGYVNGNINEINLICDSYGVTFNKDLPNTGHAAVLLPDSASIAANSTFGKHFRIEIVAEQGTKRAVSEIFTINP